MSKRNASASIDGRITMRVKIQGNSRLILQINPILNQINVDTKKLEKSSSTFPQWSVRRIRAKVDLKDSDGNDYTWDGIM
ncbi:hypothetical protein RO3G_06684 [Rhizopus delemar RA 99-880]|uniref:Uncharacterized protein n=1 Tax=Rhizopus delemar (strain RA 99-880 / ATCC MYA-4621 / FGSC 9543 / NRRL 43880) TaxID=246409 RepID=I1C0J9_RHIO9|nr:hypothetical protein RO3G_06684 [Rhizopus delemar RA 99-880]|eukprot:EIE81979.1 hypothetical protein RO3G_06684 [Rhizopus delemar RA 99-880]